MARAGERAQGLDRRSVMMGAVACCAVGNAAYAGPEDALPQKGDRLVIGDGAKAGQPVTLEGLPVGGELVEAVAVDAQGVKREGSRFAKIILVRVAPDEVAESQRAHAVDGVLALSAICTHQGCTISGWSHETKRLSCFCHHSEFLPAEGGRVAKGPARKRLPVLPLAKGEGGTLMVAGGFTAKPGPGPA
ncbi:ubiquinol-cytochrome c reductase iron-sulfur subunit [Methylobacterium nonmethylotrophicum]|uniref:Rieske (2Fe-2S) protein n=1 Tax=Methylobacterium nonmethylotrophicum TaxID=1141884 RepID=A0A4Z0NN54_9HYPH|nr:Rieske (2Fe-2S) protein [Methylobacterium nonmethylotrophicum]TGD97008.1 Rieske (2Fe-2S) protein [Methylobacterium nonmethylotrophicum]